MPRLIKLLCHDLTLKGMTLEGPWVRDDDRCAAARNAWHARVIPSIGGPNQMTMFNQIAIKLGPNQITIKLL